MNQSKFKTIKAVTVETQFVGYGCTITGKARKYIPIGLHIHVFQLPGPFHLLVFQRFLSGSFFGYARGHFGDKIEIALPYGLNQLARQLHSFSCEHPVSMLLVEQYSRESLMRCCSHCLPPYVNPCASSAVALGPFYWIDPQVKSVKLNSLWSCQW